MENNRNIPNSYYDYGEFKDYHNFRNPSPIRNEMLLPKGTLQQQTSVKKSYYPSEDNYADYYLEDQLWNTKSRRVPNSYTTFSTPVQTLNQLMTHPQNNIPKKSDMPLKGILGGKNENGQEGQRRNNPSQQGNNVSQRPRPKSPELNYRLPLYRSNENLMAAFCGGEPVSDIDDSQYYLIHEGKSEQQNYNTEKNVYDDFNLMTEDVNPFKDPNAYEYSAPGNDEFYEDSLRDFAALDLRERATQVLPQQMYNDDDYIEPESSTYDNTDNNYYLFHQSTVPKSSHTYNQNRYQNVPRSGNLTKSPISRRELYKNVSEKLNETFAELKNVGVMDKKEENRRPRSRHINSTERYSLHEHPESSKKSIQKVQEDYHFEKTELKDGEPFTKRQYKYRDLVEENTNRSKRMPPMEKYKFGSRNELTNPSLHFPSYQKQDVSNNFTKTIQMISEDQKIEENTLEEPGSFVHMHKEYSKNQSVPGCCVDLYNSYRKEKISNSMLRTE